MTTVNIRWKSEVGVQQEKRLITSHSIEKDFGTSIDKEGLEKTVKSFFYSLLSLTGAHGFYTMVKEAYVQTQTEAVAVFAQQQLAAPTGTFMTRLAPLLHMFQEIALPVGIIVSTWGLVEIIMGNVDVGKTKLKWSIVCYIGIFLIPELFYAIHDAFSKG
jgi:putative heme degradation protein